MFSYTDHDTETLTCNRFILGIIQPVFSLNMCVFFPIFRVLTELVSKMRDMQMDKTELGCLRAIVLFNPGTTLYVMLPVKNVFLMTKI